MSIIAWLFFGWGIVGGRGVNILVWAKDYGLGVGLNGKLKMENCFTPPSPVGEGGFSM